MTETRTIQIPGNAGLRSRALIDIETVKVPTTRERTHKTGRAGFVMKNGEILKNRWRVAMAGIAAGGTITLIDAVDYKTEEGERSVLDDIDYALRDVKFVVYGATRSFDEMILKGRFTNARRAFEPEPFYPALYMAETFRWYNRGTARYPGYRGTDVESRDVPAMLGCAPVGGGKRMDRDIDRVLIHLLRDVVELILMSGAPDAECRNWCVGVMTDYETARGELYAATTERTI